MAGRTSRKSDGIIDLVLVDRVVDSLVYQPMSVEERAVAAVRLAQRGHGINVIARTLRCNTAAVAAALQSAIAANCPRSAVSMDVEVEP